MADLLIIGNGPAAISAAEAIREVDRERGITIVSSEPWPAYTPCFLSRYLSGEVPREVLFMKDEGFYEELGIEFMPGKVVVSLDTSERRVRLSDGGAITYRGLIIAAGASAIVPSIEGVNGEGVYVFKTLSDVEALKQKTHGTETAVVVGAGYIGLEVAEALNLLGIRVVVVEKEPQPLARMLAPDMAEVIKEHLMKKGVALYTDESVQEVLRDRDSMPREIRLGGGKTIRADMMVVAAGVRPNIDFLKGSGIQTGKGVLVDATMRTSIEGVYAAGDIAEIEIGKERKINPIHLNAVKTGRVAGSNIVGAGRHLPAHLMDMNMLRLFDLFVFSAGTRGPEMAMKRDNGSICRIYYRDGAVTGIQMIGDVRRAGQYLWQIGKEYPFSSLKRLYEHIQRQ